MSDLYARIAELAEKYRPLGAKILKEAIRIPADHVHEDPKCGLSNHEAPRLEYLRGMLSEIGAVRSADDAGYDEYGNLVWTVQDPSDGIPADQKRVIYMDGHTDTVKALRDQWTEKTKGGVDAYDGVKDLGSVDRDFLKNELGHLPPESEWDQLIFGRGAADQLGGVIAEMISTKIMLELIRFRPPKSSFAPTEPSPSRS